jgi:hypothetical protein
LGITERGETNGQGKARSEFPHSSILQGRGVST